MLRKSILLKLLFPLEKSGVVDLTSLIQFLNRGKNVMQHLVIHNKIDKIARYMCLIEKTMDPDPLMSLMVVTKSDLPLGQAPLAAKPTDGQIELTAKIKCIDPMKALLQIVVISLATERACL